MCCSSNSQMECAHQLEWELSLNCSELISHGWYRGSLDRLEAEAELPRDGSFLVRDSASQPGHYVLSCRHAGQFLHFVINRVVIQPDTVYERFQYQFEDEAYDTVADLVTSYVGSGKSISKASGARIQIPSNRKLPLLSCTFNHSQNPELACTQYRKVPSHFSSLERNRDGRNNFTKPIRRSDSSSTNDTSSPHSFFQPESCQFDQGRRPSSLSSEGSVTTCKAEGCSGESDVEDNYNRKQSGKGRAGWEGWEGTRDSPPAKPARVQPPGYQASGSDSGNGSGDSHSSGTGEVPPPTRNIPKPFKRHIDLQHAQDVIMKTKEIEYQQTSLFDAEHFQTVLFSTYNNKPLESDTLQTIKSLLRASGPRILANHLTTVDLKLLFGENVVPGNNANPLQSVTALELCLLPHGQRMRADLIERTECLKFVIAVTILTCQSDHERADVLNDWIQLAIEVKTALGNLYAFSAVMLGLCMPQIESLETMWFTLRQKHTDAAFTFEAKLRPCFKSMNDCTDPAPPNTTIPHLLPTITLLQNAEKCWNINSAEINMASHMVDFGLSVVSSHLEIARKFPDQIQVYRRNARTVVQEMSSLGPIYDPMLLELFQTEFHIRFLWGSRGALISSSERHGRLSQVLTAMSQKYPSQS